MLFFKKTMKTFEIIDTTVYVNKIENINKSILPAKTLKAKKSKDNANA